MLIQKLLGLVNLGGQEGTPPTIRVVKKHELAVILADFVFRQGSFSAFLVSYTCFLFTPLPVVRRGGGTHESSRIKEASRRVIRGSNPLFLLARPLSYWTPSHIPFVECLSGCVDTGLRATVGNKTGTALQSPR